MVKNQRVGGKKRRIYHLYDREKLLIRQINTRDAQRMAIEQPKEYLLFSPSAEYALELYHAFINNDHKTPLGQVYQEITVIRRQCRIPGIITLQECLCIHNIVKRPFALIDNEKPDDFVKYKKSQDQRKDFMKERNRLKKLKKEQLLAERKILDKELDSLTPNIKKNKNIIKLIKNPCHLK